MQFNSDSNKRVNEVIFFRRIKNSSHPSVIFNNNDNKKYPRHKHLGIVLHSKPDFKFHVDQKIKTCNKLIRIKTGAIQGTSRQKLYDKLGLHSLSKRRWRNKLIFL